MANKNSAYTAFANRFKRGFYDRNEAEDDIDEYRLHRDAQDQYRKYVAEVMGSDQQADIVNRQLNQPVNVASGHEPTIPFSQIERQYRDQKAYENNLNDLILGNNELAKKNDIFNPYIKTNELEKPTNANVIIQDGSKYALVPAEFKGLYGNEYGNVEEAEARYRQTGENKGIFDSREEAEKALEKIVSGTDYKRIANPNYVDREEYIQDELKTLSAKKNPTQADIDRYNELVNALDYLGKKREQDNNINALRLEQNLKENGTLPDQDRQWLSEYRYYKLSDKERAAIDKVMEGASKEYAYRTNYSHNTDIGADIKDWGREKLFGDESLRDYDKYYEEAARELKALGWDDKKISDEIARYKELQNAKDEERYTSMFRIDPNASNGQKLAHGIFNTAYGLATAPTRGLEGAIVGNMQRSPYGKSLHSSSMRTTNAAEEAYGQTRENAIGSNHPGWQNIYDIGTTTAESLESAYLGNLIAEVVGGNAIANGASKAAAASKAKAAANIVTLPGFGASAYNSTYKDAVNRGASEKDAQIAGVIAGAVEMGTEVWSLDHFWDMASNTTVGRDIIVNYLAQGAIEGSEEFIGDIANRIGDYLVLGKDGKNQMSIDIDNYVKQGYTKDEAKKMAEQDFWTGAFSDLLAGAASGYISGGVGVYNSYQNAGYMNSINNAISNKFNSIDVEGDSDFENQQRQDKERYANNPTQYVVDNFKAETDEDKEVKEALQEIADKEKSGEKLSASDRAYVIEHGQINADFFKSLDIDKASKDVPNEFRTAVTNISSVEAEDKMIQAAREGNLEALSEAYNLAKNSRSADTRSMADEILNSSVVKGQLESKGFDEDTIKNAVMSQEEAYRQGLEGDESTQLTEKNKIAYNEGKKRLIEIQRDSIGVDSNQAKAKLSELTEADQSVYKGIIKEDTNAYLLNEAWDRFYSAGETGRDFEKELNNGTNKFLSKNFDKETLRSIYDAGVQNTQAQLQKEAREELNKYFGVKKASGTFKDMRTTKNANMDFELLRASASNMGIDIILANSDSGIFLKDKDGKVVENAHFTPKESAIYINADASTAQVFHEIGEFVEFYNSEGYEVLREALNQVASDVLGATRYNTFLKKYKSAYGNNGLGDSSIEMSREMTNDMLVAMMSTKEGRDKLAKNLTMNADVKTAANIVERIKSMFSRIADSIRSIIDNSKLSSFQREVLDKGAKELEANVDLFVKEFNKAVENARKVQENAQTDENNAQDKKFSLDVDESLVLKNGQSKANEKYHDILNEELRYTLNREVQRFLNGDKKFNLSADGYAIIPLSELNSGSKTEYIAITDAENENVVRIYQWSIPDGEDSEALFELFQSHEMNERNNTYDKCRKIFERVCPSGTFTRFDNFGYKRTRRMPRGTASSKARATAKYNEILQDARRVIQETEREKSFSLSIDSANSSEIDKEYFNLIENENMQEAAQLVREYAEFKLKGSKARTPEGALREFYHGTSSDFHIFDMSYLGTSSGDSGFFGKGFYFAFDRREAEFYGSTIKNAYLDIKKPFFISDLYNYKGKKNNSGGYASNAVFAINFNEMFPELTKNEKVYVYDNEDDPGTPRTISLSDFAKDFERVYKNTKFEVTKETDDYTGEEYYLVKAGKHKETWEYDSGETETYYVYDYEKKYVNEKEANDQVNNAFLFLKEVIYKDVTLPKSRLLMMNNEFSEELQAKGYDGVMQSPTGDEAVVYSSEQIKDSSVVTYDDNGDIIPLSERFNTEKSDTRYSIDVDSQGNNLTEGQVEYFKDSVIRDENGKLKIVYHGTTSDFTVFDPLIDGGKNGTAEGYGIYLTTNKKITESYGDRVIEGYANITNPARFNEKNIKLSDLSKLIKATVEKEAQKFVDDEDYDNIKDAMRDTWISNYVYTYDKTIDSSIREVADSILSMNDNDFDIVQEVMSGLAIRNYKGAYEFYDTMQSTLGIDGFITEWEDSNTGEKSEIILAINSNQVKNTDNLNPTENKDIRYSVDVDEIDFFSMSEEDIDKNLEEVGIPAFYRKQVELAGVFKDRANPETLRQIANKLRKEFGSTYNLSTFTDNLQKFFDYANENEHVSYEDFNEIMSAIARPFVQNISEKANPEEYKRFVDTLKSYGTIKLTSTQAKDVAHTFGSVKEYRAMMMPIANISSKNEEAKGLDTIWSELCDQFGGLLERDANEGDMPGQLYDALQTLRSPANNYGGSEEDVVKDVTMRILEEYLGGEQGKKIAERNKAYKEKVRKDYQERFEKAKGRYNAALIARNRKAAARAKDREKVAERRRSIFKNAKTLHDWASRPTKEKHIPRDMISPIMEFLSAFDFAEPTITTNDDGTFSTRVYVFDGIDAENTRKFHFETLTSDSMEELIRQYNEKLEDPTSGFGSKAARNWKDRMASIKKMYDSIENSDKFGNEPMSEFLQRLSPALAANLDDLLQSGSKGINNLNSDEMRILDNVLKNIIKAVNQGSKAYTSSDVDVSQIGGEMIKKANEMKEPKSLPKVIEGIKDMLDIDMLTPRTAFSLLGESGDKLYKLLRKGLNTKIADTKKASDFMEQLKKDLDLTDKEVSEWGGKKGIVREFKLPSGTIRMTDLQIMALYETTKQPGIYDRMKGGIKVKPIERNAGMTLKQNKAYHLSDVEVAQITGNLTDKQKKFADALQQYMAVECAAMGNETSMNMYGYEMFVNPTYFPIEVDRKNLTATDKNIQAAKLTGIRNSGFTNVRDERATNPIMIGDILDVFTKHVAQMADFHGYAASTTDILRWFNYKEVADIDKGKSYSSVQQALDTLMHSDRGADYFKQLLLDINGAIDRNPVAGFIDYFSGAFKASSVLANASVVIQQPFAYGRAANMIDPKYLLTVNPVKAIKNIEKVNEESPIAWWKAQGYYETSIGRSLKEIITGQGSLRDKINEKAGWAAGKADDITWAMLYQAVENEQRDKLKGQPLSKEEFRQRVNERFDDMIDQTQVVDSTLHRSQYMRSQRDLHKLQTAFMAEPTKSYNMLAEAVLKDVRSGDKNFKRTGRAVASWAVASIMTAAAKSLVGAMRHTKDDDEYWEVYGDEVKANIIDNLDPLQMIPWVKDIEGAFKTFLSGENSFGSGNARYDLDAITDLIDTLPKIQKYINGESKLTPYGLGMAIANPLSKFLGVPAYALARDVVAFYNLFFDDIVTSIESPNSKVTKLLEDVEKGKDESKIEQDIANALEAGKSVKDIRSKIKTNYGDIMEGEDEDAKTSALDMTRSLLMSTGMTLEEANTEIESWDDEGSKGYTDLDNFIKSNDDGVEDEVKALLNEYGKEPDKVIEHIMNGFGSTVDYERSHNTATEYEDTITRALQVIDPTYTYDSVKADLEQKAKEKAEKKEAEEQVNKMKNDLFTAIDTSKGSDARQVINEMAKSGKEAGDIKGYISTEYHKRWKEATSSSEKSKIKSQWINATTLVNNTLNVKNAPDPNSTWNTWEAKQK